MGVWVCMGAWVSESVCVCLCFWLFLWLPPPTHTPLPLTPFPPLPPIPGRPPPAGPERGQGLPHAPPRPPPPPGRQGRWLQQQQHTHARPPHFSLFIFPRHHSFHLSQRRAPIRFSIAAATVDPQTPSFDPRPLIPYMKALGVEYHYLSSPIIEQAKASKRRVCLSGCVCEYLYSFIIITFLPQKKNTHTHTQQNSLAALKSTHKQHHCHHTNPNTFNRHSWWATPCAPSAPA